MTKRNITLQLDEETVAEAKVLAARQGTSLSSLLAQRIRELAADAARYEHAKESALRTLAEAAVRPGGPSAQRWSRKDIYVDYGQDV
jgi:hypothetical protein